MTDDELQAIENESAHLLSLLREQRDEENAMLTPPERNFGPSPTLHAEGSTRRSLSPWWLAAAVFFGIMVGFALPRPHMNSTGAELLSISDTLHSRSLADGDLNTALLVSL